MKKVFAAEPPIALPEDCCGWEKLFSERMRRHFEEDFGLALWLPDTTTPTLPPAPGREKAPAAICRKVIEANVSGRDATGRVTDGRRAASCTLPAFPIAYFDSLELPLLFAGP